MQNRSFAAAVKAAFPHTIPIMTGYLAVGMAYGVLMADGPLAGLLARAVVVIDKAGRVVYTELVPEITEEPDYDKAVEAVKAN